MSEPLFRLENLHKSYKREGRDDLEVLRGISVSVQEKSFLTIVGRSGSGKSTILQLMAAFDKPTNGKVFFRESNLTSMDDEALSLYRNKHIGFIFQFHHLLPEFSALENVMIPGLIRQTMKRNEIEKKAVELLSLVGLDDRSEHKPSQMSGGEQQRVAIARSLMNNPEVIFADEPTGNLDSANSELVFALLEKIHKELDTTMIVVTHNADLAGLGQIRLEIKDGMFC
ncbi:MAG: ABC transporter ATP-binding protein [Bacteroidetes bacterium]|nr:ABC transporter ATP-binding protein [Bacteroidota bacterium]